MIRKFYETQVVENYDIDSGSASTYWKYKPGENYILELSSLDDEYRASAWAMSHMVKGGEGYGFVEYPKHSWLEANLQPNKCSLQMAHERLVASYREYGDKYPVTILNYDTGTTRKETIS